MAGGPAPWGGGPSPWGGGPSPLAAPPRPRANAAAAVIAGILALLTAGILVWFALNEVVYAMGSTGRWSSLVLVNMLAGVISAGALLVAAGFTFARRIVGAWTLCALCVLYAVANLVVAPLVWGTPFGAQLKFLFGFDKINGIAAGLATIFCVPTATMAAIAGSMKSYGPSNATPPRP
ncbi:hypothetical protein GCM10010412_046010 [Nonomuraea recticatena]|uniref:Uncharacterized protein n=1 Tax=Nonomuraea recticatena TaxID=46178 RepID=A0ABN3S512_9ACTN